MIRSIGVFAHMFHAHVFCEMRDYLANIPYTSDIYLTTCTEENAKTLREDLFNGWKGKVSVFVVPNRGRDIAAKLITFREHHKAHDLVLHIHTKNDDVEWRYFMFQRLLGSRERIYNIIDNFRKDPGLGIVGPEYYPPIAKFTGWRENRPIGEKLLSRLGVDPGDVLGLDFPAGSMFWARPAALEPLFSLGLTLEDFPPEPIGKDGTLAHTVERLFYIAAELAGYKWATISLGVRNLFPGYPIYWPANPENRRAVRLQSTHGREPARAEH